MDFYLALFSSSDPNSEDIFEITQHIGPLVDHEANSRLSEPFTELEVKKALFDLNPSKAPGEDDFMALFFQKSWDIVQKDVTDFALNILNKGGSLSNLNPTTVTLIPKVKNASSLKDFRPISLYNVYYKIVARAIMNRFKNILGNIIDPHQSAFISRRAISDNIILGYECMHWLRHSNCKQGYATLK